MSFDVVELEVANFRVLGFGIFPFNKKVKINIQGV